MLTVETGAGLSNANGYLSVADATAYHGLRGNADSWDAIDDKEAAIIKATDYLLQKYRGRWKGYRNTTTQALDWPRSMVEIEDTTPTYQYVASNVVPTEVKNACSELALKTVNGDLIVDTSSLASSETVGPVSVTYESGGSPQTAFSAVGAMLKTYMSSSSSLSVVRA